MNCKKASRNIKPAALWAVRQNGSNIFTVVAPLLQDDVEIFIKHVGLKAIVEKGCQTKTGSSKRDARLKPDRQKNAKWGFLT